MSKPSNKNKTKQNQTKPQKQHTHTHTQTHKKKQWMNRTEQSLSKGTCAVKSVVSLDLVHRQYTLLLLLLIHTHTHTHTHTHIYTYTHTHTYIHTYTHTYRYTHLCTCCCTPHHCQISLRTFFKKGPKFYFTNSLPLCRIRKLPLNNKHIAHAHPAHLIHTHTHTHTHTQRTNDGVRYCVRSSKASHMVAIHAVKLPLWAGVALFRFVSQWVSKWICCAFVRHSTRLSHIRCHPFASKITTTWIL